MVTEHGGALVVPDADKARALIATINAFQAVVRQTLVPNLDYGVIQGTTKPTLLKAGAEKVIKLLGLTDAYEFVDRQEDWTRRFYRYLIKCRLTVTGTDTLITEGLGECNSYEPKYRYRWVFQSDLPEEYQGETSKPMRDRLPIRTIKLKRGGTAKQYRIDNDEVEGIINTLVKMARKRSLVDAALTAGRLSELFTQDVEDVTGPADEDTPRAPAPARAPPTEPAPTDEPDLLTMILKLQEHDPDKWTDDSIIKAFDLRTGVHSKTIEGAITALSPAQLADVTKDITVIYKRTLSNRGDASE